MEAVLKPTRLVQSMSKPKSLNGDFPIGEMFAFGSPDREKTMNPELIEALRKIVYFDYMEDDDYAFPTIPNALRHMQKCASEYKAWMLIIDNGEPIYVLGNAAKYDLINQRIKGILEWSPYHQQANGKIGFPKEIIGFYELDNNFMYFVNLEVVEYFKELIHKWSLSPIVEDLN